MAHPDPGAVHVNRPLSNISIAHFQSETNFVTNRAGHTIPVEKQTDSIFRFKKGEFHRDGMKERAPGAESAGGGWDMDDLLTYRCPVYAFHHDIPDQARANTDQPISQDRAATILVNQKGLIKRELLFATSFMQSGSGWDVTRAGVASGAFVLDTNVIKWSDYTNSNPIDDVSFYTTKVAVLSGGFRPKHCVMSRSVWDILKNHPDILGRISGGSTIINPSIVTQQLVAALFELEEILVMDAVYDTSAPGAAANAMAFMGGDAFFCYYKPPAPSVEVPSAFYGFAWKGMFGMSTMGNRIKKFRMEAIASDRVEIESSFQWKQTGTDMAFLLHSLK